ncbi:ribonucleoside triphosphate reductase [Candidatus Hydrogenosomobacter endosymbioticus]
MSFNWKCGVENLKDLMPKTVYDELNEAFDASGIRGSSSEFCKTLEDRLRKENPVDIDSCMNIVKQELEHANLFDVLRSFLMRRESMRESRGTSINCAQTIEEYTNRQDWRINENANLDFSSVGLANKISGKVIANYWLDIVFSKEEAAAHRNADIHIHDLDCLTAYCAGWSLRSLLNEGFNGVFGKAASRPPKHLMEALGQMVNFLTVLQAEWAGAQAFSSFDTYLAPYVFKDNLSEKEVKRAVRYFVYNLNVPTRGGQTAFTNVTLDFTCPKDLRGQVPMCNNRHLFDGISDESLTARANERGAESPNKLTYKDFQKEMEMLDVAFYEVMQDGDGNGQPFTFPLTNVNITEDFDWDSKAANVLFENTATVGGAYFQNFVGSQYVEDENGNRVPNPDAFTPDAVRSMCCRLQLDLRELVKRGNGLFGSAEMTGSIGVITVNMARLGYRFKGNKDALLEELDRLMLLSRSILEKKRVFVQDMYNRGLYPYTKRYLRGFHNHFSTIGVNGMNEMLLNFSDGAINISSPEGIDFCIEILDFMKKTIKQYQKETGNLYNIEATPAEGASHRLAKEDRARYADIIQSGSGDSVYYTNSSQLPADFTDDPYYALEKQDKLQCKYTGGTTLHLYMSEKLKSGESCKRFVRSVVYNYSLPQFTITPVFSTCTEHGYIPGDNPKCPSCGKDTLVWTRVVGYLRPRNGFNPGKKREHTERKLFKEAEFISKKRDAFSEQLSLV